MRINNFTPFIPLLFKADNHDGVEFTVFVLKGTFRIVRDGALIPEVEQAPISFADEYYGAPFDSSLRRESDLAPIKAKADICVEGNAKSPGGRADESWQVGIRCGQIRKQLRVTGPRHWSYSLLRGWQLTTPEPCELVPLQYEYAFGGVDSRTDATATYEANPVGRGYIKSTSHLSVAQIAAPQIESLDDPVNRIDRAYVPQGFGPIAKTWLPRRSLCGTPDDTWVKERWPMLPEDFSFDYYNHAHPCLQYPGFLNGDEEVIVDGCHIDGTFGFRLPGYRTWLSMKFAESPTAQLPLDLDTAYFNIFENSATLVWRVGFFEEDMPETINVEMSGC
jgi:hypothetical protein